MSRARFFNNLSFFVEKLNDRIVMHVFASIVGQLDVMETTHFVIWQFVFS
jgi:hypothetical protein